MDANKDIWAGVDRRGPFECWPKTGGSNGHDLRVIYELATGLVVPRDKAVYRKCNGRGCVNPRHLALADRGAVVDAIGVVKAAGDQCRVAKLAKPVGDRGREPKTRGACSYCWHSGKPGRAIVCGTEIACPVCTAPGYAETLKKHGADSA